VPALAWIVCLATPGLAFDLTRYLPGANALPPLQRAGEIDRYDAETLWQRIDGAAGQYRRFGLREAAFAYYEDPNHSDRALEVSLFSMDYPLGAFGLLATFRSSGTPIQDVGNGGMGDDYQVVFWHGNLLVSVHAFGPKETRSSDLQAASKAVASKLGAPPARPAVLARFESLTDPSSVRLYPDHIFGLRALPPGLVGSHRSGRTSFLATVPVQGEEVLAALGKSLDDPRRLTLDGAEGLAGTDRHLGFLAVAQAGARLVGFRSSAETQGIEKILLELLDVFQQ
jgi:hypothetical protein